MTLKTLKLEEMNKDIWCCTPEVIDELKEILNNPFSQQHKQL